jgi:glutamate-1-semialdehyde 2,1-aminomutase
MIHGHAHPSILKSIRKQLKKSSSYGAPCKLEIELAKKICGYTGVEKIRFVSSGTEATMTALRIARAYTGKDKIIKFEGCYHGHADPFLIRAGSGALTLGKPDSKGIPESVIGDTLNARYNNIQSVEELIHANKNTIAAIIIEPAAGNMGCVLPQDNFLQDLRSICNSNNILLIFDEVITGFRIAKGGAQEIYQTQADLITYGKIIGGGLPVGAIAGKEEYLSLLAPEGPVYQAGTLSGNPAAMAAGLKTLELLNEKTYNELGVKTNLLINGIQKILSVKGLPYTVQHSLSLLTLFFNPLKINNLDVAKSSNLEKFKIFHSNMLKAGIYLPPSQFECWFISTAHSKKDIKKTIEAIENSL